MLGQKFIEVEEAKEEKSGATCYSTPKGSDVTGLPPFP
jgi:hypothetical protein